MRMLPSFPALAYAATCVCLASVAFPAAAAARAPQETGVVASAGLVAVENPALPKGLADYFLAQEEERPYLRNYRVLDPLMGDPGAPGRSRLDRHDVARAEHRASARPAKRR